MMSPTPIRYMPRTLRASLRLGCVALVLGLGLVLAACGGDDERNQQCEEIEKAYQGGQRVAGEMARATHAKLAECGIKPWGQQ